MNLLIIGDSFAADWTPEYPDAVGWPNLVAQQFSTTNLAQAGCSEYKIKKQLDNAKLSQYTHCIVVHTSPTRIPVEQHPLHANDKLHYNCDFIYNDIAESKEATILCVKEFYEKYFYIDYFVYVHELIANDINDILIKSKIKFLHITFFNHDINIIHNNYYKLFHKSPGFVNHLSKESNLKVANNITKWLSNE